MKTELKQLSELFKDVTFKFHFISERLFTFRSVGYRNNKKGMIQYELDFFINDDNYFGTYMTFKELIDLHRLFEVKEINLGGIAEYEVLYHEKYKDDRLN